MATITSQADGNASSTATWAGGVLPGPTDHWVIEHAVTLDSGLGSTRNHLNAGGEIEVNEFGSLIVATSFTVKTGASIVIDAENANVVDVQGSTLAIIGGALINNNYLQPSQILQSSTSDGQVIANQDVSGNPAILTNFAGPVYINDNINTYLGLLDPGFPATIRESFQGIALPSAATFLPAVSLDATVQNGAMLDFATRDGSGNIGDPDNIPCVAVMQGGSPVGGVTVTLRWNSPGSYTATFPTPTENQAYYVPIQYTIGGTVFIQEFHINVVPYNVGGKVLGGGSGTIAGAGVITANPAEVTEISVTTQNTTITS